jgi:hypothetical protein
MAEDDTPDTPEAAAEGDEAQEHRDELPEDLDASGYVGPYVFPDNKRRRVVGAIYAVVGVLCLLAWLVWGEDGVLVNEGMLLVGIGLLLIAAYHVAAGYPLELDEHEALVAATREVGFPVGHASAQMGWRGLRSRPTWRLLVYSADEPPTKRGLVLVDGVDGEVVSAFVEDNPEDWSQFEDA